MKILNRYHLVASLDDITDAIGRLSGCLEPETQEEADMIQEMISRLEMQAEEVSDRLSAILLAKR